MTRRASGCATGHAAIAAPPGRCSAAIQRRANHATTAFMALFVDIRHWLDERGDLPRDNLPVRRQALRIAQLIEAGGPLQTGQFRETLVACSCRPHRKPCMGLLWVEKAEDDRIWAYC